MKQLTFAELAQILKKSTGKTQESTVNTLFDWVFEEREHLSQTSAHRYFTGESDIHKYIYKDGNDNRDTKSIRQIVKFKLNILVDRKTHKGL